MKCRWLLVYRMSFSPCYFMYFVSSVFSCCLLNTWTRARNVEWKVIDLICVSSDVQHVWLTSSLETNQKKTGIWLKETLLFHRKVSFVSKNRYRLKIRYSFETYLIKLRSLSINTKQIFEKDVLILLWNIHNPST